jgi:excisionase family DNA binding protein
MMAAKARDSIIVSPVGQIYTTAQVASILQVHRRTVERLIMQGHLQAIHVGRRLRVTTQQLQDFVAQQGVPVASVQETTICGSTVKTVEETAGLLPCKPKTKISYFSDI